MKKYQNKRTSTASNMWTTVAVIAMSIVFIFALKHGLDKQVEVDCYKWQSWVKEGYVLFTPSQDMILDCRAVGVDLRK